MTADVQCTMTITPVSYSAGELTTAAQVVSIIYLYSLHSDSMVSCNPPPILRNAPSSSLDVAKTPTSTTVTVVTITKIIAVKSILVAVVITTIAASLFLLLSF